MLIAFTDVYEILRRQFGDEDARRLMDFFQQNLARLATKDDLVQLEHRLMSELVHKADKEDFARLWEVLERKADKEDVAALRAELQRKADKEDVARLWEALERKADKEDVAQLREMIVRLEWRMNFYFAVLLLVILLTNPKVWELLARLLPFVR